MPTLSPAIRTISDPASENLISVSPSNCSVPLEVVSIYAFSAPLDSRDSLVVPDVLIVSG